MYNHIKIFSKSHKNYLISFLWGLAEGTFFFIIPDVYIGFISLFSILGGFSSMGFALLGSLTSAIFIYLLYPILGDHMTSLLLYIPGITKSMIERATTDLILHGLPALITGPVIGIPYKIYTVTAAQLTFPISQYLFFSIPSRLERTIIVFITGSFIGYFFSKKLQKHPFAAILAYIILWTSIYSTYFWYITKQMK